MLIGLQLDLSVLHSFLWVGWTTAFLKSLGNIPLVRQELIVLCKVLWKLLYNFCRYIILLGFLYVESFCFFKNIIYSNTYEKTSFIFGTSCHFINDRNTSMFLVFLNSLFNWIRNVGNNAEVLLVDFDSKIWYYISKESIKSICYFLFISR